MIDYYKLVSNCFITKDSSKNFLNRNGPTAVMMILLFMISVSEVSGSHGDDDKSDKPIQKVVYHVSEAKKVPFVLGNINNHIDGVGGPGRVQIIVVVHGSGHDGFLKSKASQELATEVDLLQVQDVKFEICGNTLSAYGTTVNDLVGEFKRLNQGGVVRIVELQQQGFAYLRP